MTVINEHHDLLDHHNLDHHDLDHHDDCDHDMKRGRPEAGGVSQMPLDELDLRRRRSIILIIINMSYTIIIIIVIIINISYTIIIIIVREGLP